MQNNTLKSEKIKIKYLLSTFIAIVMMVFSFSGYTNESANYVILAFFAVWLAVAFFTDVKLFINTISQRPLIYYYIFLLYYAFTLIISCNMHDVLKYLGASMIFFSPLFIFIYYYNNSNYKYLKMILNSMLCCFVFFSVAALIFYQENDNAARILASKPRAYGYIAIGGGYGLAYAACAFSIYIFDCFLMKRFTKKGTKLFYFVLFVLSAFIIFETRSTLTIIAFILGILFSCIIKITSKNGSVPHNIKSILASIVIVIVTILVVVNIENIGQLIIDFSGKGKGVVSLRIKEIGYSFISGSTDSGNSDDLHARINLIGESLKTYFNNFFLGIGYKYSYDFSLMAYNGIGAHGEWVDSFAKYGTFGAFPLLAALISAVKRERKLQFVGAAYVLTVVFMGIFNPFITFQSMIMLLFIIPAMSVIYGNKIRQV